MSEERRRKKSAYTLVAGGHARFVDRLYSTDDVCVCVCVSIAYTRTHTERRRHKTSRPHNARARRYYILFIRIIPYSVIIINIQNDLYWRDDPRLSDEISRRIHRARARAHEDALFFSSLPVPSSLSTIVRVVVFYTTSRR